MNILILEDDVVVGRVFKDGLQDVGHRVKLTHCNDSATEALVTGAYDLVIADLMIGKETSIPALDCARFFCPHAEIILVTGSGLFPHGELHFALSHVAYRVQKPITVDLLVTLVAHFDRTAAKVHKTPEPTQLAAHA